MPSMTIMEENASRVGLQDRAGESTSGGIIKDRGGAIEEGGMMEDPGCMWTRLGGISEPSGRHLRGSWTAVESVVGVKGLSGDLMRPGCYNNILISPNTLP